jgi:hypothetical protein
VATSTETPSQEGEVLGDGVLELCCGSDKDEATVAAIAGVDPRKAVVLAGHASTIYLSPGTCYIEPVWVDFDRRLVACLGQPS